MRISYVNPKYLESGDDSKLYFGHTVYLTIAGKKNKIRMTTADEFDEWMLADPRRQRPKKGFIPVVWLD